MGQTLQYGVTRAQESEAVDSHISCEEPAKQSFSRCTWRRHTRKSAEKPRSNSVWNEQKQRIRCICEVDAAVDTFRSANTMLGNVPPWKAALLFRGPRMTLRKSVRREQGGPASALDLTFVTVLQRVLRTNVKSKRRTSIIKVASVPFGSNVRRRGFRKGMRTLEPGH